MADALILLHSYGEVMECDCCRKEVTLVIEGKEIGDWAIKDGDEAMDPVVLTTQDWI